MVPRAGLTVGRTSGWKRPSSLVGRGRGGGVMVWAAFSGRGKRKTVFVPITIDSSVYGDVLATYMLPFAEAPPKSGLLSKTTPRATPPRPHTRGLRTTSSLFWTGLHEAQT